MEVRSYRNVFALERRVYSIDRLRLNPGGVPVLSLVYMAVISLSSIVVSGVSRCLARWRHCCPGTSAISRFPAPPL